MQTLHDDGGRVAVKRLQTGRLQLVCLKFKVWLQRLFTGGYLEER